MQPHSTIKSSNSGMIGVKRILLKLASWSFPSKSGQIKYVWKSRAVAFKPLFFKTLPSWLKYESYDVTRRVRMWHIAVRFTYHVNEDTIVLQALEVWNFLCFIVCRHSLTCECSNVIQSCKCNQGRVSVSGGRDDKGVFHSGRFWLVSKPSTLLFLATVASGAPPEFARQTLQSESHQCLAHAAKS